MYSRKRLNARCWRYALERSKLVKDRIFVRNNGGNYEETVKMEDTKVPRVKEFKYLGSTVKKSGSCEREVKRKVRAGGTDGKKYRE